MVMPVFSDIECYMWMYVGQVWFHNHDFRTAVLLWKDSSADDTDESFDEG